tara:strand:- start:381 stop:1322 length:942 start_codon:yes stop_codon:yes gene_type:complete
MADNSSSSFERKNINGKPNPKYVDLLDEDKAIAGQKFTCVSFISPENVLKQKELFFFENFLKKWDFNKSMEKFVQFTSFLSYKYNLSFDDVSNDLKEFVKEEKETLSSININDEFKTFVDNNEEELEKKFNISHNFTTSVRGLKIRGSYPTLEEAEMRAKLLREIDPNHDVFVGPVGLWMPWDPEAYKTGKVEYMEDELNQLMKEKNKNDQEAKVAFDERVKTTKKDAIKDNIEKAEKSGNVLTQTVDKDGNLIGINNNTQIETLTGKDQEISSADICNELFEGENIIMGKSDNGKSQLVSGPFVEDAKKKND